MNCLILEYAANGEFFDFVEKGPLPEHIARYYFKNITKAVHCLHSHGFAHYDIKTENIFVNGYYDLKLGDFGVTRRMNQTPPKSIGTRNYLAPEYHVDEHFSAVSGDIFSLGVVLFILVMGHPPFNLANK